MAAPHQVMFLAGGFWAIVAVGLVGGNSGIDLARAPLGGAVAWHAHEMVFGFAAAMFAGYALTAMGSWSRHCRLSGPATAGLFGLWLVARLAILGALGSDPRLVAVASVAFMACVALILLRAACASRSGRGAVAAIFALAMTGVQLAVICGAAAPDLAVLGFAALLSVVGGRIVGAFTRNGLTAGPARQRCLVVAGRIGCAGSAAILSALCLQVAGFASVWIACGLLIAASAEALRIVLWLFSGIQRDGLLVMLHIGYSWLPLGLVLVALGQTPYAILPAGAALHALTAGAIACTIHAMAARAVARRADRLRSDAVDAAGFAMLWVSAALRVFLPEDATAQSVAPLLWCLCWSVFLVRHGVVLAHLAPRPVFSGPRRKADPLFANANVEKDQP